MHIVRNTESQCLWSVYVIRRGCINQLTDYPSIFNYGWLPSDDLKGQGFEMCAYFSPGINPLLFKMSLNFRIVFCFLAFLCNFIRLQISLPHCNLGQIDVKKAESEFLSWIMFMQTFKTAWELTSALDERVVPFLQNHKWITRTLHVCATTTRLVQADILSNRVAERWVIGLADKHYS